MNVYTYNYPIVYTPESNNSYINKRSIIIKECVEEETNELANTWNQNLCGNDDCYYQPVNSGDIIYDQYVIPTVAIKSAYPMLINEDTGNAFWVANNKITIQVGDNTDGGRFVNCILDTTGIPAGVCKFYIKWVLYYEDVNFATYSTCVATQQGLGMTLLQAMHHCIQAQVNPANINYLVREPYGFNDCGLPTILIKGEYPGYDCNGRFYAPFTANDWTALGNSYIAQFRVYGEIENDGFVFTETLQNKNKKSSKQVSQYTLRTKKIPPYVAAQIAVCFNSKKLTIDGIEYKKASELSKNNDEGQMWIINTQLTSECDEINFTCS